MALRVTVDAAVDGAKLPLYASDCAAGADITVTHVEKRVSHNLVLCGTGLYLEPPPGFHTELVGRSSLIKSGWQLANCVGIIDEDYRGQLMVALLDLTGARDRQPPLGTRVAQLLVRRTERLEIVQEDALGATARGAGGFGSTGQ